MKKGFSDEALSISGEIGVIMVLTRRVFLGIITVVYGRKMRSGKYYILHHREDARDIVLARSANAK